MATPINGDGMREQAEEELRALGQRLRRVAWGLRNIASQETSAAAMDMAADVVDEALLRLGPMPFPSLADQTEEDPLVLRRRSRGIPWWR